VDDKVLAVFKEYEARAAQEARAMREGGRFNRDEVLLWVGPDTGKLLHELVIGSGAKTILELGTSYGYSGVWLADAARKTGGTVITCDVAGNKQDYARGMIVKAGLSDFIDFRMGDARETIKTLSHGIDFVLVDLWKDLYVECLELFFPKLAAGATIVADNMLRPVEAKADALAYRRAVRAKPGVTSVLLPVGSGIEVSRLNGPQDEGL
jgi:predicted O-methyltransferase YrrM